MFILTPDIIAAAHAHALADFPREACGVVVAGEYRPMTNVAETPEMDFRIAASEFAEVADDVEAVLHSHPNGDPWPTRADMVSQIATAVPWGVFSTNGETCSDVVMWGDNLPIPELIGRPFVHGVTDCFAAVRDYWRLHRSATLPDVPRDYEWWLKGQDLYSDGLTSGRFSLISQDEARPGDGFLCSIRSPVPNHAGILWDDGLIFHHLQNRLSRREPVGPWLRHITHWVRLNG